MRIDRGLDRGPSKWCPSDTSTHHSAPADRGATGTGTPAPFEPRRLWSLRVDEESALVPVPVCVCVGVRVVVVWAVAQSQGRRVSKPGRGAMTARASAEAAESASALARWGAGAGMWKKALRRKVLGTRGWRGVRWGMEMEVGRVDRGT